MTLSLEFKKIDSFVFLFLVIVCTVLVVQQRQQVQQHASSLSQTVPCVTPGPTVVPTKDVTPIPSVTSTPILHPAVGKISLHFDGIDSQNNSVPRHPQRQIFLSFYTTGDFTKKPVMTLSQIVTFSKTDQDGSFINDSIDLSFLPSGQYYVLVKSTEGSLQEVLNNAYPIAVGTGRESVLNGSTTYSLNLPMGDLNNNNIVDISDYNILVDCYESKSTSQACKRHAVADAYKDNSADMNDDGVVNGIDYNILMRNFEQQGYGMSQTINIRHFTMSPCVTVVPTFSVSPTSTPLLSLGVTPTPVSNLPPALDTSWKMVFSDDFIGTSLDSTKWVADSERGKVCENVDPGGAACFDPSAVSVSQGNASIESNRQSIGGYSYLGGIINTQPHYYFTYGYFEERAKLPKGNGFWSAIWLYNLVGNNNEIDIIELLGKDTTTAHQTFHAEGVSDRQQISGGR